MTKAHLQHKNVILTEESTLTSRAANNLSKLTWLSPIHSISSKHSTEFGRQIELSLNQLTDKHPILRLLLRKSDKAVVIETKQYEEILEMKTNYIHLIEKLRVLEIKQAANEFDKLYLNISSTESRAAADSLFSASSEDLNTSFKAQG